MFFAAVGREFVGYQDELEAAATILEKQAKDLIGVPQPEWAPLAPATLERKGGVNTPLLETGEMRDSITHNADAHEAHVGSNNPKLNWHEFGSIKLGGAWGVRIRRAPFSASPWCAPNRRSKTLSARS